MFHGKSLLMTTLKIKSIFAENLTGFIFTNLYIYSNIMLNIYGQIYTFKCNNNNNNNNNYFTRKG